MPGETLAIALLELGPWRLVHLWLAATVIAAAGWVRFAAQRRYVWADYEVAWWLWHWFTGGPLETGRSFPYEGDYRAQHLGRRAAVGVARTCAVVGLVAVECVRSGSRATLAPTVTAGLVAAAILVAHVAVKAAIWVRWVRPLHWAVCVAAGWGKVESEGSNEVQRASKRRPGRYITIPRGLAEGGGRRWFRWGLRRKEGVVVKMAPTFQPRKANLDAVVEIVKAKVPMGDVTHKWVTAGRHSYVLFRPKDPIRELAPFSEAEVRTLLEGKSTSSTFVLGLTRGDRTYKVNLDRESPHVLMSAATGGGKSTMLTLVAAQLMWHGAEFRVGDYKRHSLRWLRDLPGVQYARDIGEIHRMLIELAAEGDRRNRAYDHIGIHDEGPTFHRIVLLLEELSTTSRLLRDHWTDIKQSGDPPTSPAIRALTAILNMGRAVRINVIAVAQRASANSMGDGDIRENYSVRILAEHTPQTWKMLTSADFVPRSKIKGRVQVCVGDDATEVQVILMTEEEAQRWVADKRGMQPIQRDDVAPVAPSAADSSDLGESTGHVAPVAPSELVNGVEPVTLWEASADKGRRVVALSYDALRKASERDPEFPPRLGQKASGGWLHDPVALQRWENNRPMAKTNGVGTVGDGTDRVDREENEGSAEEVPLGGYPQGPSHRDSDRDRFLAKVDQGVGDGCQLWTGALDKDGYGIFSVTADGVERTVRAHRWAYEDQVGPIPEGYTLDHLDGCLNPSCVRPDHLEPVTAIENLRRRHARQRAQQGATS